MIEAEGGVATGDEQLMWRVKMEDDSTAFAQLVTRWQRQIHRLCARMTGDLHRAEDLAQEAFARVFTKRKHYEPSGRFSTFLWRIALNLCYDELRKLKRRKEFPLEHWDEDRGGHGIASGTPDTIMAAAERAEAVRRALQQLEEPYRAVLVLRHYEGLKFREIAEVLKVPEGTVKSRMAEGLTRLSGMLRARKTEGKDLCKHQTNRTALAI
jgi:RNA polymerase sigma-70 factor (ECF subfamily)